MWSNWGRSTLWKGELLDKMLPISYGGGMNLNFTENNISLVEVPYRFEAGTPNISGIISFLKQLSFKYG